MVDIDNNGILTLMMIIGGEVKRGYPEQLNGMFLKPYQEHLEAHE